MVFGNHDDMAFERPPEWFSPDGVPRCAGRRVQDQGAAYRGLPRRTSWRRRPARIGCCPTRPAGPGSCGPAWSISEKNRPCVVPLRREDGVQWAHDRAGEDKVHVVVIEDQRWLFVGIYDGFNGPRGPGLPGR
uniref:protein-serine/threonine phosphatase n=1 Tax=Zea mays TaxID=4577 RepID=A0A804Q7Q3_MAIZE